MKNSSLEMVNLRLILFSIWICYVHGIPGTFQKIQFLQPSATSFTSRRDGFVSSSSIPAGTQKRQVGGFFFEHFLPISHGVDFLEQNHGSFHHSRSSSNSFFEHFHSHTTPDFSDGLAYTDPFLRTGTEAQRKATYLYSKELSFNDIPHTSALLYNQQQRKINGLALHKLGSLRLDSPWYRYRGVGDINSFLSF